MLFNLQQIAIIAELCVYFINQMINDFPRTKRANIFLCVLFLFMLIFMLAEILIMQHKIFKWNG